MSKTNIIELVAIYIILTALSYGFYIVLVAVEADEDVASSLLSWSATIFATIALLYTFNTWREQKSSDVLSTLSKEFYLNLNELKNEIDDFNYQITGNYPLIEVNIVLLKDFLLIEEKILYFKSKIEIIFDKTGNKCLYNQINEISNIIKLFNKIKSDFTTNRSQDMNNIYYLTCNSVKNFNEEFNEFKNEVDKILIYYMFYKQDKIP